MDLRSGASKAGDMPRSSGERYDALDALRGFALLGIFIINIIGFGLGAPAFMNPYYAGGSDSLNVGLWQFTTLFVDGSMRGLFSLMFGAGVVLFVSRAAYPDGPIRIADLHYRRTIWLIVFGLIHGYLLLAPGDILFLYGIMGLFLFPLRILSPRTLLIGAGAILALTTALLAEKQLAELHLARETQVIEAQIKAGKPASEEQQEQLKEWQQVVQKYIPTEEDRKDNIADRTGDLATIYSTNWDWTTYSSVWRLFTAMLDAGLMMLIGMALLKSGWLTGAKPARSYVILMLCGYSIGLGLRAWLLADIFALDFSPISTWPWIFQEVSRMAMTLGHVGMFLLLWQLIRSGWLMRGFAAAGRMAFTNYIGQTVIANLFFIGTGLYAELDRVEIYAFLALVFFAQMHFSLWWLGRYRFGPLEWLWRSQTYGEIQPFRRLASEH